MQILFIPDSKGGGTKTCLSHRQAAVLGLVLILMLPALVGVVAYRVSAALDRTHASRLDPADVVELKRSVEAQRRAVEQVRERTERHLDALALRLGKMQAHLMRVNALGQRLTEMAGLEEGEFDFGKEPAVGGPERLAPLARSGSAELAATLDALAAQIDRRHQELELLETLLMDHQLQASLDPVGWPVLGGYVSSRFGYRRDPFTGRRAFHEGVDIATRRGAPVKAIASGVVSHVGPQAGYGLMVEINHGNGYATRYAHTLEVLVAVGQRVEKGQTIALVGASGRTTGPHLHFELLRNGRSINPRSKLRAARR